MLNRTINRIDHSFIQPQGSIHDLKIPTDYVLFQIRFRGNCSCVLDQRSLLFWFVLLFFVQTSIIFYGGVVPFRPVEIPQPVLDELFKHYALRLLVLYRSAPFFYEYVLVLLKFTLPAQLPLNGPCWASLRKALHKIDDIIYR